LDVFFMNVVR